MASEVVYFRTLKSGCSSEEGQFEFLNRELNAIAVYMLVAWRVNRAWAIESPVDCVALPASRV